MLGGAGGGHPLWGHERRSKGGRRPRGVVASHRFTYPVFMKNVTIALDDALLREARRIAADRSTTLNAMIREYLQQLAERESRAVTARRRIVEICRASQAEIGPRTWERDELHER